MRTNDYLTSVLPQPDNSRRPVQIIHNYYPRTEEDRRRYLDEAEKTGLGGFVVNMDFVPDRVESDTEEEARLRSLSGYLADDTPETEAAWEALIAFMDDCFSRGMEVWIYDERAYPSGAAGNRVLDGHPDYQVKGLICQSFLTSGGSGSCASERGTCRLAEAYPVAEDGSLITAEALPVTCAEGVLSWDLPAGNWRVAAFFHRPVEFYTENRVPYADLMRADVTDRFIEVTHEVYRRKLGEERLSKITAFFTDEPGLPTHGCSSYFYETGAVAAWTEEMDSLLSHILPGREADLFFETDRDTHTLRRRYWQCAAKLFAENYFGRIGAWCERYGTRLTGHLYGEETLSMQIGLNADLFGLMGQMQMPGVDRLYCMEPRDVTAEKTASSAAHLRGTNGVMTENSFHLENHFWNKRDETTNENRLNSAFYQIQLGVTHISSYFGDTFPYSHGRREFEEKAARAALFCDTGRHRADVLVLIPMEGAYERFMPPDHKYWNVGPCIVAPHQPKAVQVLEEAYGKVLENLENARMDFDLIDSAGLATFTAENGTLATPYETFTHLVVFDSGKQEPGAAETIEKFLASGGRMTLIDTDRPDDFLGKLEQRYPKQVTRTAWGEVISAVWAGGVRPLFSLAGDEENPLAYPGVRVRKSETEDAELWFLHNREKVDVVLPAAESGTFTRYGTDGAWETMVSENGFALPISAGDAVMLVREK